LYDKSQTASLVPDTGSVCAGHGVETLNLQNYHSLQNIFHTRLSSIMEAVFQSELKRKEMEKETESLPAATFDQSRHSSLQWVWRDFRFPEELQAAVRKYQPETMLELGCSAGMFYTVAARQRITATGVDFSAVVIERAKRLAVKKDFQPTFPVGDITDLNRPAEPFDLILDAGCFLSLNEVQQQRYTAEVYRLLKPDKVLLIWALSDSVHGIKINPDRVKQTFEGKFRLMESKFSRRRMAASHWYWLQKV
jgi:SAM-dependent methyltransferase